MNIKKILLSTTLLTLSLLLSACGGSNDTETTVSLSVQCTSPDTLDSYQSLNAGDTIMQAEGSEVIPKFSIFYSEDGTKKACINSGAADIVRA